MTPLRNASEVDDAIVRLVGDTEVGNFGAGCCSAPGNWRLVGAVRKVEFKLFTGLVVNGIMCTVKAPDPLQDITEMQRVKFVKDLLTAANALTSRTTEHYRAVDLAGRER